MSETAKPVAIEVTLPPPQPLRKLERERRAFFRLLPELLESHRGQFVAIHGEKVLGFGSDQLEVAIEVWKRVGKQEIYVGRVTAEPEPVLRSGVVRVLGERVEGA